jgi:hypothetical protein
LTAWNGAELEREQGQTAQPATPGPAAVTGPHDHDQAAAQQIENQETGQPALKINGFGHVDFSASNLHGANGGFEPATLLGPHSSFPLGQTTLHLIPALSPKVSFFSEITFVARREAGTGTPSARGFNPEVERLIVRYDTNDFFKLSVRTLSHPDQLLEHRFPSRAEAEFKRAIALDPSFPRCESGAAIS